LEISVRLWEEAASPYADFLRLQCREISDLRERRPNGVTAKAKD